MSAEDMTIFYIDPKARGGNVPAKCLSCGSLFKSAAMNIDPGVPIHIKGNFGTNCPICGGLARLLEGTIITDESGGATILNPSAFTKDALETLKAAVERAKAKEITVRDLLESFADVSPELATKLREKPLPFAGLVLLALFLIKSCTLDVKIDVNKAIDQIRNDPRVEERIRSDDALPPPASAAPRPEFPIAAVTPPTTPSRQVRRQLERQARKSQQRLDRDQV